MKNQTHWVCALSAVMVGISSSLLPARAEHFWLEAGPVFRGGMQIKVSGTSYAQALGLHATPAPLSEPASVGPAGAYADRLYDDGYVRLDISTLDPDVVGGPGNTWNWAYDKAGQFDPAAKTLSFQRQGEVGYTTLQNDPVSGEDEFSGAGLQLVAGWKLMEDPPWRLDLCLGFQGIWGANSRMSFTSYRERTGYLTTRDTYDVTQTIDDQGNFPLPRTAPGGYAGMFDVPGPVIPNVPTARANSETVLSTAENQVNFKFETEYYEFTLGPRLIYVASRSVLLHVEPKLGVGFFHASAERSEVFTDTATGGGATTLGSWHDRASEDAVQFVIGITAGVDVELGKGYFAGLFGGYEHTLDPVHLNLGPNQVSLDSSGAVVSVVLGKRF